MAVVVGSSGAFQRVLGEAADSRSGAGKHRAAADDDIGRPAAAGQRWDQLHKPLKMACSSR